jgi:alkylation response protein AidB-like acyl-CoA dehydrogenase
MTDVIGALVARDRMPVSEPAWDRFWDRLHGGNLVSGEAAAVLASLSTAIPDCPTLCALVASLREYGVEKELRNAVAGTIYSGTSEVQRDRIAKMIGL